MDVWIEVAHIKDYQATGLHSIEENGKAAQRTQEALYIDSVRSLSAPNQVVQTSSYWTEMQSNFCSLFKSQNCTAEHTNTSKCDILNDLF